MLRGTSRQMLPMYETTMSPPDYTSFLVRMWRESDENGQWLVQVEHILSGDTKYCSSLEDLFEYLRLQTEQNDSEIE